MQTQRYLMAWLVLLSFPLYAATDNPVPASPETTETVANLAELNTQGISVAGGTTHAEIRFQLPVTLEIGGVIEISQHWSAVHSLQIESPTSPNFVKLIVAQSPVTEIQAHYVEVDPRDGELSSRVAGVAFEVMSGSLEAGTEVRMVVEKLKLPKASTDGYELPLHVKTDPAAAAIMISGASLRIEPGEFRGLYLSASSMVATGEVIDLWVRLHDAYGNIARANGMSLDLLVNGVFRQRVDIVESIQQISGISFETPGVYELELRTGGGGISATSNPVLVSSNPFDITWIDLGTPSRLSEGVHSLEELARRGLGRYDLVLPADHREGSTSAAVTNLGNLQVQAYWDPLSEGGARFVYEGGVQDGSDPVSFVLAKPEQPTDLRRMIPENFKLVEIVSGGSVYDWFGQRAANFGFRIGFTGSNHTHQYSGAFREVNTAIRVNDGQNWLDALSNGQTYVSVGTKMVLVLSEEQLNLDPVRRLGIEIVAGAPIDSVEVFKNGDLFKTRRQRVTEGDTFRLVLESSSDSFSRQQSKPRNAREWLGYIVTQDSDIVVNSVGKYWQVDSSRQPGRVDFYTRTHGLEEFLEFKLAAGGADTVIEIDIAPGYEDAAWLPVDRLPQPIPGQKFLIPLSEALQGATRTFEVEGYRDAIRVEPSLLPLGNSMNYVFDDPTTPHLGDYYYFRIRLSDGSFAYTSPVYVGDF